MLRTAFPSKAQPSAMPPPNPQTHAHSSCTTFHTPPQTQTQSPTFNQQNRFHNDTCFESGRTTQSSLPGMYRLSNFYHCDGAVPTQTMAIALDHPMMQFRDGYGPVGQQGGLTDVHSSLRNGDRGEQLTNYKGPQQLPVRQIKTVPFMGRGLGNPCMESSLKEGVDTSERKQCNTLAEIHLPHQYTPLISCLHEEVQNPVHILHEANQSDWIRGGYPSRQWVHQRKFNQRCPQRGGVQQGTY
jgi:hypothetical protein